VIHKWFISGQRIVISHLASILAARIGIAYAIFRPFLTWRPLQALRAISDDPDLRTTVPLADGRQLSALEIQRIYLSACRRFVNHRAPLDAKALEVLDSWEETLEALEHEPARLVGKVDWVTKRYLLDAAGTDASIAARRKLDMRYHELSPDGYYLRLETVGIAPTIVEPEEVLGAVDCPPERSPATARGRLIRHFATSGGVHASWSSTIVPVGSGVRVIRLDLQ
jgi:hypothetical protein